MSYPLIQIVDEHDEPLKTSTITEAQTEGWFHRIVRVMVEDIEGRILLQRRASDSYIYPDRWDNSAAGHVDAGEDYMTAALRELYEEIGLKDVELERIGYYKTHFKLEWRNLNRFNSVYRVVVDPKTEFVLDPAEVSAVKWFTKPELYKLTVDQPDQFTDGALDVLQKFYQ